MKILHLSLVPLAALFVLAEASCATVHRSIGVRSDPPGATVYIDGLEVGKTPIDYINFDFYGTREIALYRDGYLAEKRVVNIRAPWYDVFPLDIFSEVLLPVSWRDQRQYYFAMTPTQPPSGVLVRRNAEETRDIGVARIASARERTHYRPRSYVYQSKEKPSILWGPFFSPPRVTPSEPAGPEAGEVSKP